uniref:G-protein coupled receptors family 1 profile domain-containing protein n=1 Tax=Saimiri boliviensis boliviensis TaxID=39432 RepID=A0A2K6UNH3_SAIBB
NNFTEVTMFLLMSFTEEFEVQVFLFFYFYSTTPCTIFLLFYRSWMSAIPQLSLPKCWSISWQKINLFHLLDVQHKCFLLLAIYNLLLYSVNMSPRVYVPFITASYVAGILHATIHTVATFSLSFCGSNEIRHVFCDIPPLLTISCSDTHTNQFLLFYFVVSIYHGTILFMYVRPSSSYVLEHDMIVSIFYTIVIPMLNPIIYSLRNKDVKEAMKKMFGKNQDTNNVYFHTKK